MVGKSHYLLLYFCILSIAAPLEAHAERTGYSSLSPSEELDLEQAVSRVLTHSLTLKSACNDAQMSRHQLRQAQLAPNPVAGYEVENFAGNNRWKGWDSREERIFCSQQVETAGKRDYRSQASMYQYYAALVGYDVSKLVVLNRLSRAFIHVAASQELLKLAEEQASIAEEVLQIATKKAETGKVSFIEQTKAEVAYSDALSAVDNAKVELNNSKKRLSLLFASACPDFDRVVFPFYEIKELPSFEQCLANLCNQPEIIQSLYQTLKAEKSWKLEKAGRIPDVTVEIGYKANYEESNRGLMAGISIPIPLFDQNQGNVKSAYYEMLKTGDLGRQLWLVLESRLSISHEDATRAYLEAKRIKERSLPSATKSFELAQKGYQEGKFEYLDVLDAERTLFGVKERYIQSLVNYHTRQADIDYLNSMTD
ncbi:TolC family protein [Estrella lausannensis]|uniref:Outer membrane efflux protein n=1 Tax=Estrella lausannensis TaxID=483423 RepID=A0A0H5DQ03_9BACT|nr:TolC family protein [Estrella lausannensis]CRX37589.1 Outer membrane efflux protein [Estrella lausannensis]